jgi:hypothetical protein
VENTMTEKTLTLSLTEAEASVLHLAIFELRGRPIISHEELRALHNADQKLLRAALGAEMALRRVQ